MTKELEDALERLSKIPVARLEKSGAKEDCGCAECEELRTCRRNAIKECADLAESLSKRPGWSPGYRGAAEAVAKLIRSKLLK